MKTINNNPLAAIVTAWKDSPCSLVTLRDMIEFLAARLVCELDTLHLLAGFASVQWRSKGDGPITAEMRQDALESLRDIGKICKDIGLERVLGRISETVGRLSSKDDWADCSCRTICTEIDAVQNLLRIELGEVGCLVVPKNKVDFYLQKFLLGPDVACAFPLAQRDIFDAGNCLALNLNTAAVFHLMRVLEFGLRALAGHLKVKTVKKRVPVAYGTWEEIIRAISLRIEALSKTTKGPKRQKELDFYNGLLIELRAVKDYWRNAVMHARDSYDQHQAMSVFTHVKTFMQRLAKRIPVK